MNWTAFAIWLLVSWGFLWVRKHTDDRLECNFFSAALASALFVWILHLLSKLWLLSEKVPGWLELIFFIGASFGGIPAISLITLVIGNLLIPWFKVEKSDLIVCTKYLSIWVFFALFVFHLLQFFALLLLASAGNRKSWAWYDDYF